MLSPKNQHNKNISMLIFFAIIATMIFGSMASIKPVFFVYLVAVYGLAFLFFYGGRILHRTTLEKCPKCGGLLYNMGIQKVFKASLNADNGKTFPPIGKRIFRCEDCENEFHELIDYPYGVAATAYKEDHQYKKYSARLLRLGYPDIDIHRKPFKTITEQEYVEIKNRLIQEVTNNNTKNGFVKNGIKI